MSTLRKVLAITCTIAFAAFGAAACGSEKSEGGGGGGGGGGGEINIALTSFPDYVDPQLSYTVEGWEVLWNVYTPLLTYKHAKGKDGTQVVPGLAQDMPEISPDGKTYKLKLRPNMKYSDGTPIKASDFAYGIQRLFKADSGGSVFFDVIVGRNRIRRRQGPDDQPASRPTTTPATSPSTLKEPNGTFENVLALMFAAPVPPSTPLDKDATNNPPPSSGPFMITKVNAPRTLTMERNPNFQTVKDAGRQRGGRRQRRQDHRQREQEQQRPGDRRRAEQGRLHGRPAGRRTGSPRSRPSTAIDSGWRIRSTPTTSG